MKKTTSIGLTLAILNMFVTCSVNAEEYTLWAGQDINAGKVIIRNDSDTLYVTYITSGGWKLVETHVHVALDPTQIPQTQPNKKGKGGGNPIPGLFQFSEPPTNPTIQTYEISLDEISDAGFDPEEYFDLYVAAHAEVVLITYNCKWQIGDEEVSQFENPVDELNYDSIVTDEYDFYVGTTQDYEFPWLSTYDVGLANPINIHFNADMPYGADFSFSWSPGAFGTETLNIMLDGTQDLGTISRNGASDPAWWGAYERFTDSVEVPPISGNHILTISFSSGDDAVWDWLRLEEPCVQEEESAWAGDIDFPGANWATYCEYTYTPELDICTMPVFMSPDAFAQFEDYDTNEIVLEQDNYDDSIQSSTGLYIEMDNCDEKMVVLKQVDCADIGKGTRDYPCHYGCEMFKLRANFEVKLRVKLQKEGDIIESWSAYYDGGDIVPGDGNYHLIRVCLKSWKTKIENIPPDEQIQVGTLTITAKPNL